MLRVLRSYLRRSDAAVTGRRAGASFQRCPRPAPGCAGDGLPASRGRLRRSRPRRKLISADDLIPGAWSGAACDHEAPHRRNRGILGNKTTVCRFIRHAEGCLSCRHDAMVAAAEWSPWQRSRVDYDEVLESPRSRSQRPP